MKRPSQESSPNLDRADLAEPLRPHSDLAKNSAFSTVTGLLVSVTGLVSTVLIARTLGVEGAGLVAFAVWIAFTGAGLAAAGISTSLTRYVPELRSSNREELGEAFAAAMFRVFGLALALALISLVFLWYWMPGAMEPSAWILVCILTAVQALAAIFTAYLKGRHQFDRVARLAFSASLLQLAVLVVGVLSLGENGALLGYIAGGLLPAVFALQLLMPRPSIPGHLKRRVLFFASLNWVIAVISGVIWYRAELFFIQLAWGLESVGLFSTGLALANVATLLPALLLGALLPHFSSQMARNEIREMRATYTAVSRLIGVLVFPICFGAAAICPVLVPMLYGPQFAAAVPSAMIVVAGSAIGIAAATNTNVIFSVERVDVLLAANAVGLIPMIVGGLVVVPLHGIEGAALTRVVVQTIVVAIEFWFVVYRLGFEAPVAALLKAFGAALVCAAAAYLCVVAIGGIASLLVAVPVGAATYVAAVRSLGALDKNDRRSLESAVRRMPTLFHVPMVFCIACAFSSGPHRGKEARD